DELFTGAPGSDSGISEEFLEANHLNAEVRTRNAEKQAIGVHRQLSAFRVPSSALNQASGLVLRRPVMRSPSFHWPRFLSNSVRSKRLSTFRLPPKVAAARRLRCCDINRIPTLVCLCFNRSHFQSGGFKYHAQPSLPITIFLARRSCSSSALHSFSRSL